MYQPGRFNKLELFLVAVYQLLHAVSYSFTKVNACSELHKYNGIDSLWTCADVLLFFI